MLLLLCPRPSRLARPSTISVQTRRNTASAARQSDANQPEGTPTADAAPVNCDMVLVVAVMLGMVLLDHNGVEEIEAESVEPEDDMGICGTDEVASLGTPARGSVDAGMSDDADEAGMEELEGVAAGVPGMPGELMPALGVGLEVGVGVAAGIGTGVLPTGMVRTVEIGVSPQTVQATTVVVKPCGI